MTQTLNHQHWTLNYQPFSGNVVMDNAYIPPLVPDNQPAVTPDSSAPKSVIIAILWYAPSCENMFSSKQNYCRDGCELGQGWNCDLTLCSGALLAVGAAISAVVIRQRRRRCAPLHSGGRAPLGRSIHTQTSCASKASLSRTEVRST